MSEHQREFLEATEMMDRLIDRMSDAGFAPESAFAGALTMLAYRLFECSENIDIAAELMTECINSAALKAQLGEEGGHFVFREAVVH
jgi:hypothetical protein